MFGCFGKILWFLHGLPFWHQDSEFPFPWTTAESSSSVSTASTSGEYCKRVSNKAPDEELREPKKQRVIETIGANTPPPRLHLQQMIAECRALGCIDVKLCDLNALAGTVLRHSIDVMNGLIENKKPLIFKVGFTHNPIWRWSNDVYGYQHDKEKWSNMIVIHYAREPFSPAMLESALIEKFKSNLLCIANPQLFICILCFAILKKSTVRFLFKDLWISFLCQQRYTWM